MKRFFSLLLILTVLFLATGCSQTEKEEAVLPPTRIAAGTKYMSLMVDYSFESAFEDADVVVRAKIGDWLGENTESHKTYFSATVLECFKGDIPEQFTLMQEGCSTVTQYCYPLFTAGNELLLFLFEATGFRDYESAYWIAGAYMTTIDVAYDTDGNRYYLDRYGILCDDFYDCTDYTQNSTIAEELRIDKELNAYLAKVDPFFEIMNYSFPRIFPGVALEEFMGGL